MPRSRVGMLFLAILCVLAATVALVVVGALLSGGPSSAEVVEAFREEGLEVGEVYPVERTEEASPGVSSRLPGTYEEGTRFEIPSLGRDSAGRSLGAQVFTFESEEDLAEVRDFYQGLDEAGFFSSRVFDEENVLVQMSGRVPEDEARRYQAVLEEVA